MRSVVLGARGRLGAALVSALGADRPPASTYRHWWQDGAEAEISRWLASLGAGTVYVACGLLDRKADPVELRRANFLLARNVVGGALATGWKAVTFGTILEGVDGATADPYVEAKAMLSDFMQRAAVRGQALHVRLHTLYGGTQPEPGMFLGQILAALRSGQTFLMSPGTQLREYHHVQDDALAVRMLVEAGAVGQLALSHGAPVTLRDLATAVFDAFGRQDLLRVGALPAPTADSYRVYPRTASLTQLHFRDSVKGVIEYVRACLDDGRPAHG